MAAQGFLLGWAVYAFLLGSGARRWLRAAPAFQKLETEEPRWVAHLANSQNFYRHDALIWESAVANGLDPDLWKAIIMVESSGDRQALSWAGAMGLAQLMPGTARSLGLKPHQHFDPQANLSAGAGYFRWLLKRFGGNLTLAVAAYNSGPGAVATYGGIPPFEETRKFVNSVLTLHRWLGDHPQCWAMNLRSGPEGELAVEPRRWIGRPLGFFEET